MSDPQIVPERITKPIQLLGAWLAGLIVVNGSFLATAAAMSSPEWIRILLALACVANVPLFLFCLFRLQTKFRPEMQEDVYYAKYLELSTGKPVAKDQAKIELHQLKTELVESRERSGRAIESLESQLKALGDQIDGIRDQSGSSPLLEALSSAASEAEKSAREIEAAFMQVQEPATELQVNDLIPSYAELRSALDAHKLVVTDTFGSTSSPAEKPPTLDIGFGTGVPIDQLRKVVRVAMSFGFKRIHFSPHTHSADTIYLGSYIYRHPSTPQPVPLAGEVLKVLEDPDSSIQDVIRAIDRARI